MFESELYSKETLKIWGNLPSPLLFCFILDSTVAQISD